MVQLFWSCTLATWDLTSILSMAYKTTEKGHLLTQDFQKPEASFLLTTFPRAPRPSALPVKPITYTLHKHEKVFVLLPRRDGSQELAVVRKPAHTLLGLIFCSGEKGRWNTPNSSCSPFKGYQTFCTLDCMSRRSDSTAREGWGICLFPAIRVTNSSS